MEIIWGNIAVAVVCFLFGYLLGGFPNGVVIGKVFFHKDPRDYGSHNSGGTNCGRVFGKWIGILVIALDMMKCMIVFWSVWAVMRFSGIREAFWIYDDGVLYTWLAPLGAAIGHCYPIYLHFKGGKAVACYMGLLGGTSWLSNILCWLSFMPLFLGKKVVSIASLISSGFLCLYEWVMAFLVMFGHVNGEIFQWNFGAGGGLNYGWESASVVTIIYLLMVFRHAANIKRLAKGEEAPLTWPSK
jgi:glycerol-3-phosphate acyltransferase PlsY